ncbi:alpha/beta hydrolase [Brenneria sp. g21c3]|uniref:alpha/beta fold hydrolase n=1 Tax=Brenneria sp. g21c3 TaxID=3093893 RepID=UPI002EC708CA|nr:alpha/beta hydrolase [Brenneria sp. g21c3]
MNSATEIITVSSYEGELSPYAMDIWVETGRNENSHQFTVALHKRLPSAIDPERLKQAAERVLASEPAAHKAFHNDEGMTRQIAPDISIDVQDAAIRLSKPALIIGATHDHLAPSSYAKTVVAAISGSRYVELDTGHLAHIERPDEFISLLKDFFLSGDK